MSLDQLVTLAFALAACVVVLVIAPAYTRWWMTMPKPRVLQRVTADGWVFYYRSIAVVLGVLFLGALPGGMIWSLLAAAAVFTAVAWKYRARN